MLGCDIARNFFMGAALNCFKHSVYVCQTERDRSAHWRSNKISGVWCRVHYNRSYMIWETGVYKPIVIYSDFHCLIDGYKRGCSVSRCRPSGAVVYPCDYCRHFVFNFAVSSFYSFTKTSFSYPHLWLRNLRLGLGLRYVLGFYFKVHSCEDLDKRSPLHHYSACDY